MVIIFIFIHSIILVIIIIIIIRLKHLHTRLPLYLPFITSLIYFLFTIKMFVTFKYLLVSFFTIICHYYVYCDYYSIQACIRRHYQSKRGFVCDLLSCWQLNSKLKKLCKFVQILCSSIVFVVAIIIRDNQSPLAHHHCDRIHDLDLILNDLVYNCQ